MAEQSTCERAQTQWCSIHQSTMPLNWNVCIDEHKKKDKTPETKRFFACKRSTFDDDKETCTTHGSHMRTDSRFCNTALQTECKVEPINQSDDYEWCVVHNTWMKDGETKCKVVKDNDAWMEEYRVKAECIANMDEEQHDPKTCKHFSCTNDRTLGDTAGNRVSVVSVYHDKFGNELVEPEVQIETKGPVTMSSDQWCKLIVRENPNQKFIDDLEPKAVAQVRKMKGEGYRLDSDEVRDVVEYIDKLKSMVGRFYPSEAFCKCSPGVMTKFDFSQQEIRLLFARVNQLEKWTEMFKQKGAV